MKVFNKYIKILFMLLMCIPFFGCNRTESDKEKANRINNSIVNSLSSNDYDSFFMLFSEEAREYLQNSIEEYDLNHILLGKELNICNSEIYGGLKQLGVNKYESFDVKFLINDNDGNYYLVFYSYCKIGESSKSVGVKRIIIINSDNKGTIYNEYVDYFKSLGIYGFYLNI